MSGLGQLTSNLLPNAIPNESSLNFYGELARNANLRNAAGFTEEVTNALIRKETRFLALAARLLNENNGDPGAIRLRQIYGSNEKLLAEDLKSAADRMLELRTLQQFIPDELLNNALSNGAINGAPNIQAIGGGGGNLAFGANAQ